MYISLFKLLTVNWYPVKMVVVRCLILCSKFAKNRLSDWGNLQRPRPCSWIMGEGRRNGRRKGRRWREGEGKKRKGRRELEGREGKGRISPEWKSWLRPWVWPLLSRLFRSLLLSGESQGVSRPRIKEFIRIDLRCHFAQPGHFGVTVIRDMAKITIEH